MNIEVPSVCPNCNNKLREIPAGISKRTGKPYQKFYSCPTPDCGFIFNMPKDKSIYAKPSEGNEKIMEAIRILNENLIAISKKIDKLLPKD